MQWLVLFIFTISTLWSAPALSIEQQFQQPDGTTFTGRQQGDEYLHWIETEDGEIVLYNKKGKRFEYATVKDDKLVPSGESFKSGVKKTKTNNGAKRASLLHQKVNKGDLSRLWQKNRQKEMERRNKSHLNPNE